LFGSKGREEGERKGEEKKKNGRKVGVFRNSNLSIPFFPRE
jgi:hypothetical protein